MAASFLPFFKGLTPRQNGKEEVLVYQPSFGLILKNTCGVFSARSEMKINFHFSRFALK